MLKIFQQEMPMAFDILSCPTGTARLAPVEGPYAPMFCFALLAAACALASFAFACATPFAAFAVVAAAMLPLQPALLTVTAAWLVNQGIGFGMLRYPVDANTVAWGFSIGAAALAATVLAHSMLRALPRAGTPPALACALLGAYVAYELFLFAVTPVLGGEGAFTFAIVGRLGVLNLLWLIGLVAGCEVFRLLMSAQRRRMSS
jgi:hypothetical protein